MNKGDLDSFGKILLGVVSAKFGPGAIGRIGTLIITGSVLLTLICIVFAFVDIRFAAAIPVAILILIIYAAERSFRYAEKHPELAAMDGSQISKWLTQQSAMKPLPGLSPPPEFVPVTTQNPLIEAQAEERE